MDLYSSIFTRMSCRKFDMTPAGTETIQQIESFITGLQPLLPNADFSHKIAEPSNVKGMMVCKAPHYMLISGKDQPLRNTCAGFLYQHAELYLVSKGFAACWLGGVKSKQDNPEHIIGLAFGKPAKPEKRSAGDFKRKPINEISEGTDSRLEAARLAPSGINLQPWFFIAENGVIHAYYKKNPGGLIGKMYNLTDFDIGIALCHVKIAGEHEGKSFKFLTDEKHPQPKDFTYIGTVI